MKKLLEKTLKLPLWLLVFTRPALADHTSGHVGSGSGLTNPLSYDTLEEILDAVAGFLFTISIPIMVIIIIIGAFQLITAGGSEEKIRKGKKTITWAVIGFVVVLVAGSIASLIKNIL